MFDLGTSFLASIERDPAAEAIVDGRRRLTYAAWYRHVSALVARLDDAGLRVGDRLVSAQQNSWEAATLHWACQLAGVVIVPVNWRATPDDIDFFLDDAEAKGLVFDAAAADSAARSSRAAQLWRLDAGGVGSLLAEGNPPAATPRATPDALSLMLYTSGTTARPKGVPRRHAAERAAALAHVAQNAYLRGERTLGVMPLYHTMGVRSLLAMSLLGGCFACLPRFEAGRALALIQQERLTCLYLVPTLYHDLLHHPDFPTTDHSSVRCLGFAGAPMTDGLLQALKCAFAPRLFVNHYGSSEIYTVSIEQDAPRKPGSAGRAALNQRIRVVRLGAASPDDRVAAGIEGEIIATLTGDEAFDGYWKRPEADAKTLRDGWYFTGDSGYLDADGDLFVTGRVDDMIITGGENVSPVEIESCLSLHPGVLEVAVVGLPDERWGRIVAAFVKRRPGLDAAALDAHCRGSGLASFKRPRRYVFVADIPKSPVGKLLRRMLVAGQYQAEPDD